MPHAPEIFSSSIVAVGAFNPAIFSPDWLEGRGLIGVEDAEAARTNKSLIISSQVATVQTNWFALQVLDTQFSLTSQGALSPVFRDLAVGIMTLLPQTPVSAVGLNFMGHYKMASRVDYDKVGDRLVPKGIWKEIFSDEDEHVGVQNLTVSVQKVKRETDGGVTALSNNRKNISIEPSGKLKLGLFLSCNDHREIDRSKLEDQTAAERVSEILESEWQASWDASLTLFDELLTKLIAGA